MSALCPLIALALGTISAQGNLANDRFVTFLPSGTAIRVFAVSTVSGQCWAPNGDSLDPDSIKAISNDLGLSKTTKGEGVLILFDVLPLSPKRNISVNARLAGTSGEGFISFTKVSTWDVGEEAGAPRKHRGYIYFTSSKKVRAHIDIGVAEKPFQTIIRSVRVGQVFRSVLGPDINARVRQL